MNKKQIFDYNIIYDNNGMISFCEKDSVKYCPFRGNENMSGLISCKNLEKGLISKTVELRRMSY